MGQFKTVSKKKKFKRKVVFLMLFAFFVIISYEYIKTHIKIDEKYLKYLTYDYLGVEFKEKKEVKKEDENKKNTINTSTNEPKAQTIFKEEYTPLVYLYNTHQTENYKYNKLSSYNIDYTVMFASYILQSYLEELNIKTIVETDSISKILNENGLNYAQSYRASRMLLEKSILKYPSLKYFIDIHRDSSSYDITTCEIDGKKYAKALFVIGLEHDNYQKNRDMALNLSNRLKELNECLSRGILEKSGKGVDGKYNQDFNEHTILIEIGGVDNEIEEVNNTLKALASILYEYIMEDS